MYGGYLITQGEITFAEITACVMLGGRVIAPVKSIMNLYLQRVDIQILKERMETLFECESRYDQVAPKFPEEITGTVEIIDLAYKNIQTHHEETLTCQIPSGKMISIDPSEFLSYKEVIFKIIGREKIGSGKVLIDNLNISKWNLSSLSGKIEYLCDDVGLYKGSVMDNVTYFNPEKTSQAFEAAALTGLDVLVSTMSEGFETQIEAHSKNQLSAAFLQRLNLTRALIVRPRILIVDRIDESMDKETFEMFLWLLGRFKNNMTVIIISTDDSIVKMASDKWSDIAS